MVAILGSVCLSMSVVDEQLLRAIHEIKDQG